MKKRLKVNGIIIFLAVLLIIVFPRVFFRRVDKIYLDNFLVVLGVLCVFLGQVLRVSARGYKAKNSRGGYVFVQGGPYSLVRNPMYLGILLIGLGIVLILFKWWVGVIFLLIFIVRYILLIFKEEKKLITMFPQEYPGYKQRVPRLLPSWDALSKKEAVEYLPLKLAWVEKEIGSILAVMCAVLIMKIWQGFNNKNLLIYLAEAVLLIVAVVPVVFFIFYLNKRTINATKDG